MARSRWWWWMVAALGLSACVGEAPSLPELVMMGNGGATSETTGGASSGDGVSTGPYTSSVGEGTTTAVDALGSSEGSSSSGTTGPAIECGNGDVDPGEECDGVQLGGQTCQSLGRVPGALACTASCMYDISGCAPPGMVVVPGGEFEMGSNESSDEQPIRQVHVNTFYIDQTEVTVADYAVCVGTGICSEPGVGGSCNWMVSGREGHPVNCVTWFDAVDYCGWAGGGTKRLPTEAEWEKAARGTDARTYPWGDVPEPSCSRVVMDDPAAGGDGCGDGSTMEVGSKSPEGDSPYGAQDMAGNVWEWVSDWYASGYDRRETDNPTGPTEGTGRVVRGGSWNYFVMSYFRAAYRFNFTPGSQGNVGFRCTRTPPAAL